MYEFAPGSTGKSVYMLLRDSTTGQAKKGLTPASPGARAGYTRANNTAVAIALVALGAADAPWQAGGIFEVSQALQPGIYRFDMPDAANAAGVPFYVASIGFDNTLDEGALVLLRNPVNNVGAGATAETVTVNNSSTGLPLAGARVWVSTDLAGGNVVAGALTTNSIGQVTFQLDLGGSYYLWISDPGYTASNPTPFTVT